MHVRRYLCTNVPLCYFVCMYFVLRTSYVHTDARVSAAGFFSLCNLCTIHIYRYTIAKRGMKPDGRVRVALGKHPAPELHTYRALCRWVSAQRREPVSRTARTWANRRLSPLRHVRSTYEALRPGLKASEPRRRRHLHHTTTYIRAYIHGGYSQDKSVKAAKRDNL